MMEAPKKNWKTTALGAASLLSGIAMVLQGVVGGDTSHFGDAFGLLSAGFVGIFAADGKA